MKTSDFVMSLPDGVIRILESLRAGGHEGYVVGGCVRDALLGLAPKDYDICTDASPEEMQRIFFGMRVIETGLQHGTLTVVQDGQPYEVTTYRIDGEYADHRHPDQVTFVRELRQDLARRDFTVNAMAYSPEGGLQDDYDGVGDLSRGLIRCVGDAERRFDEDALRILRALRFAAVYGFEIEEKTSAAAHRLCAALRHVALERITSEFGKLLCGKSAQRILETHLPVVRCILPHPLQTGRLDELPPLLAVRLAHLLEPVGDVDSALSCLRLDNRTADAVKVLHAHRETACPSDEIGWKRLLRAIGQEHTALLAAWKSWEDAPLQRIIERKDCWQLKTLAVTGRDLMQAGVPKGKEIGRALDALLEAVICEAVPNDREALLTFWRASGGL